MFAVDYRGYGLSTGSPTERGLYLDVDALVSHARELPRPPGTPVVYWGRSLGTAMAAYAATQVAPDGVILEAGFPSGQAVARQSPVLRVLSWFAASRFPTAEFMHRARVPALVIHGTADSVIPYALGLELHAALPPGTPLITIEGGDHNDAEPARPEVYWPQVAGFVGRLN